MPDSIDILPCLDRHQEGLARLILSIQRDEFGIPITLQQQPDLLDVAGHYAQGNGGFWIALDGEAVVGSIGLLDIGAHQGALRKMFVAAPYRGTPPGIAARLLQVLLDHARRHDVRELFLGTTERFVGAHRFYEKHGFSRVDHTDLPGAFPVMAVDRRFYRRTLAAGEQASAC